MTTIPAMFEALKYGRAWLSHNDRDWLERLMQRYEVTGRLNKCEREILEAIYKAHA